MTNVLLCSENYIKENSALNDNYFGKWLLPAIKNAQEMGLQTVLGECLYKKILNLVADKTIKDPENIAYKDLLDNYIREYLMYLVLKESVLISNVKLANMGTKLTEDERIVSLSQGEADLLQNNFEDKADFYCKRLQQFILNNIDAYPEISECQCNCQYVIKPNLTSSESSGIYLGGIYYRK